MSSRDKFLKIFLMVFTTVSFIVGRIVVQFKVKK